MVNNLIFVLKDSTVWGMLSSFATQKSSLEKARLDKFL